MPGYVNDTQTLANIVSPAYAAQQAGIQNANTAEQEQLANQKAAAELPYAGPMQAADVAYKNSAAGLNTAQGQKVGLENLFTGATQPGAIKATNAENQNKYTASQAQNIGLMGQIAGQLAGQLDNVPAAARPAFMQQFLTSKGLNPDDFGPLAQGDPDMMRNFSQKAIQASSQYQTELMKEQQRGQNAENVATITSEGRVTASANAAAARVAAANIAKEAKQQALTFEQAAVQAETHGDKKTAEQFRQAAVSIRQMAAQTTQQLVGVTPTFAGFDQGEGGGAPAQKGAPQQSGAPAQSTSQGTFIVGDTEYLQLPDGSWVNRKAQK